MTDTYDDISDADRDSSNRAYNAARAEWHSHRASVAVDSGTRNLHEKFVALYRARAQAEPVSSAQPIEL